RTWPGPAKDSGSDAPPLSVPRGGNPAGAAAEAAKGKSPGRVQRCEPRRPARWKSGMEVLGRDEVNHGGDPIVRVVGIVDRGHSRERIESPVVGNGVMILVKNGLRTDSF